MKTGRMLLLTAMFFIEIRVHATESDIMDCWGKRLPCAVTAGRGVRHLQVSDIHLGMKQGSLIEHHEGSLFQIIQGQVLINTSKGVQLKTPYAEFSCEGACAALVDREQREVTLQALKGEWIIRRTGERENGYSLVAGLQIAVSEVGSDGVAHMEIPQSLPWGPTTETWAKLFKGSFKEFKAAVSEFRIAWNHAVEQASLVHSQSAHRSLASHHQALARKASRRKAQAAEDRELRELFRRKTYIDP